jgi:hypothetical protein
MSIFDANSKKKLTFPFSSNFSIRAQYELSIHRDPKADRISDTMDFLNRLNFAFYRTWYLRLYLKDKQRFNPVDFYQI